MYSSSILGWSHVVSDWPGHLPIIQINFNFKWLNWMNIFIDANRLLQGPLDKDLANSFCLGLKTLAWLSSWEVLVGTIWNNCLSSRILIYQINVPVRLLNFEKKPWSVFLDYFWPVKITSIDWLDSWFYFIQSARNQGNQLKWYLLLKNNHKT